MCISFEWVFKVYVKVTNKNLKNSTYFSPQSSQSFVHAAFAAFEKKRKEKQPFE